MPAKLFESLRGALFAHPPDEGASPPGYRPASVLVPIYPREEEVEFVFVQRSEDLRHHAGQIAFPGGRRDFDGEDALTCALREAKEEIALIREYRTRLIADVVTGKLDVRGVAVQEVEGDGAAVEMDIDEGEEATALDDIQLLKEE